MRKLLLFLTAILCLSSCSRTKDPVVAQVYYHKLYLSEIRAAMPTGLSTDDSLALVKDFVDSWIKEQLLIHEAEQKLSPREKNFRRQLGEYRNHLLVNAFYEKLVADSTQFGITDNDMEDFIKSFGKQYTVDKEIVKVNYVKLARGSRLIAPVKAILFDEERRRNGKEELTAMLGDSVEYLIEDTWLYLQDVQNDVPFDFNPDKPNNKYVEKDVDDYHYLLVILDYKNQRSVSETEEEQASARMMLMNQRRQQIIDAYVDKLYEKAIKDGAITQ